MITTPLQHCQDTTLTTKWFVLNFQDPPLGAIRYCQMRSSLLCARMSVLPTAVLEYKRMGEAYEETRYPPAELSVPYVCDNTGVKSDHINNQRTKCSASAHVYTTCDPFLDSYPDTHHRFRPTNYEHNDWLARK